MEKKVTNKPFVRGICVMNSRHLEGKNDSLSPDTVT